jgi:hypothetical protein
MNMFQLYQTISNRSTNTLLRIYLTTLTLYDRYKIQKGYIGDVSEDDSILDEMMDSAKIYLYPHLHFTIGYNVDQIVAIQISTDVRVLF